MSTNGKLQSDTKKGDFLIIGGGIAGLTVAQELASAGNTVTVVDAGYAKTSDAAAGILSSLPPWECDPRIADLIASSSRRFFSLIHEVEMSSGIQCEWQRKGMLILTPPPQGGLRENTTIASVFSLAPNLSLPSNAQGLWLPSVLQLQPTKLIAGLTTTLKKQGIRFVLQSSKLEYSANKITGVRIADGTLLTAGNYILAAGAHSGLLCPPPAPPIKPVRGQLLLYAPSKPLLCIILTADGLYLVPRNDGTIIVGSTFEEDSGFDNRTNATALANLHKRAVALFPCLAISPPINAWSGLRPYLPKGVPFIGVHPQYDNLYLNAGYSRHGIAIAPAGARHLRKIIANPNSDNPLGWQDEWAA